MHAPLLSFPVPREESEAGVFLPGTDLWSLGEALTWGSEISLLTHFSAAVFSLYSLEVLQLLNWILETS